MACPDKLTFDLWLADALPAEEAATVAAHARTCAVCAMAARASEALHAELGAALALDHEERSYLAGLRLSARWRGSPARAAPSWGWMLLAIVVGGYLVWTAAAPMFASGVATATRVGFGTVPLYIPVGFALDLGQALLDVARHPALSLSNWALVPFGLALLLWPRQLVSQRSTHA